ncbi:MAG: type IV pilin protein [Halioglobus sp.]|nr:type IV pilin protein [Halioglobus sp.]
MTRRDGPGGRSRGKSVLVSVREKPTSGFTLIELMMVIVIVAVLTMIAYPAYQSFTVKANRAEAQSYLMDVAQKQQLYFNDTRTYAADEAELNVTTPERVASNYVVTFDITTMPLPAVFAIIATPKSGTRQDGDGVLSIQNTGEKYHGVKSW